MISQTRVFVDTESLLKPLLEGIAVDRDVMAQVAMMQAVMLSRPNLEKVARATDLFLDADNPTEQEQVLDSLQDRIRLESSSMLAVRRRDAQANQFVVRFDDADATVAHRVVQALLDTFMEDSLGMKRSDSGVAQRFLIQRPTSPVRLPSTGAALTATRDPELRRNPWSSDAPARRRRAPQATPSASSARATISIT